MSNIAWYKHEDGWYLTDFTKEQVEGIIDNQATELTQLRAQLVVAQKYQEYIKELVQANGADSVTELIVQRDCAEQRGMEKAAAISERYGSSYIANHIRDAMEQAGVKHG